MRILLAITAGLLIAQYGAAQQPGGRGRGGGRGAPAEPAVPVKPSFECFENVETPEFPHAALQENITGTVYVTLDAGKVDTQVTSAWPTASKILVPPVEKAVRASKLKQDCAGKSVEVAFRFEIGGNPIANPVPVTRTESRMMVLESQPELVTAAKKPPAAK
jgi:hypothetical protein